jgi:hypothetical protein
MSTTKDLLREATATLHHGAAILRLASMEIGEQKAATELWRSAKAVEQLIEPIEELTERSVSPQSA